MNVKLLSSGLSALFAILVAVVSASSVFYPPLFGAVVGTVLARWWEIVDRGQAPLMCGGSQRMSIVGKKFEASLAGAFPEELISAGGDCRLELIDCDLSAPNVISAGGSARILIRGGKIRGGKIAISAGGNAVVEVDGTLVEGVVRGDSKRLVGISAGRHGNVARSVSPAEWNALACEGVADCFSEEGFAGQVSVQVVSKVGPDGRVIAPEITGQVPNGVRRCLSQRATTKKLDSYDGKPGQLRCVLTGTINGGTQMVASNSSFSHARDKYR